MEVLMANERLSVLLREARLEKGYSEEDLGELLGLSHAAISNYENEKLIPSDKQLRRLAEVFGMNLEFLIDLAEKQRCKKALKKLKARYRSNYKSILLNAAANELDED